MSKTDENLNTPIAGQFKSSPFYIALGAPILTALASIALTALCYRVLPEIVARELMGQINPMLLGAGIGGSLFGSGGMVARAITITKAKIKAQSPVELPKEITAAGDVNLGQSAAPDVDYEESEPQPSPLAKAVRK